MKTLKYLVAGLLLIAILCYASTVHAATFVATAYDLSPHCCGKDRSHPQYGITASGFSLVGHTWQSAMTVSADTSVFPLGTRLRISFPPPYEYMNGTYTVQDTGGGIKGYHIDIFMGEHAYAEAIQFGRRLVNVIVLQNENKTD